MQNGCDRQVLLRLGRHARVVILSAWHGTAGCPASKLVLTGSLSCSCYCYARDVPHANWCCLAAYLAVAATTLAVLACRLRLTGMFLVFFVLLQLLPPRWLHLASEPGSGSFDTLTGTMRHRFCCSRRHHAGLACLAGIGQQCRCPDPTLHGISSLAFAAVGCILRPAS